MSEDKANYYAAEVKPLWSHGENGLIDRTRAPWSRFLGENESVSFWHRKGVDTIYHCHPDGWIDVDNHLPPMVGEDMDSSDKLLFETDAGEVFIGFGIKNGASIAFDSPCTLYLHGTVVRWQPAPTARGDK